MLNLTEEEIANLPVDMEFSKLVAIEIMGWKVGEGLQKDWWMTQGGGVIFKIDDETSDDWTWNPGDNLRQAFKVLDKFPDSDWHKSISNCCCSEGKKWCVFLYENSEQEDSVIGHATGNNIAEVICKACLSTRATDARENRIKELSETQETDD